MMPDDLVGQASAYFVAGGVGAFTLAVLRLAYGSMRDRTADLKDRITDLEADRDYWRSRFMHDDDPPDG
jgi:hypothetical protein